MKSLVERSLSLLHRTSGAVAALCVVAAFCAGGMAHAADAPSTERLQVTDPYIELRTGPGRGYPIFFVAARAGVDRHRAAPHRLVQGAHRRRQGRLGAAREQLETTLTEAGVKKTFRDIAVDDYLRRRVQLGAAWGQFKSEPMLKLWTSYKLSDTLSAEATIGQVQGVFSGTDFWHVNLMAEPWSDQRLSPFFAVGCRAVSRTSRMPAWWAP